MKTFEIPVFYKSPFIGKVKELRKEKDPRKKDFSPTLLDFGPVSFLIGRHFGFCYGVENAIEISYRAIDENPGKRIFLLSQMIHNQEVNNDLNDRGIRFIFDTEGNQFIPWEEVKAEDIVIIPAFGTTLEIEKRLQSIGVETQTYNTTCPFVEKVWNRSQKLGEKGYTIIIHGKHKHEETRATFSHSSAYAASLVIRNLEEAKLLGSYMLGNISEQRFLDRFSGRFSDGFDAKRDLEKIGVVNQTTMLASETQTIAEYLKDIVQQKYGEADYLNHYADTRDTLCYATNDNQRATLGLLEENADLAIVVGGYNSSNTSHLVELCEEKYPTYFINSDREIEDKNKLHHYLYEEKKRVESLDYLPSKSHIRIVLTSGASCPDALVDKVLFKLLSFFEEVKAPEEVLATLTHQFS